MNEIWLPVVGSTSYEVSNYGRVRSLDMILPGTLGGEYIRSGVVLKGGADQKGYRLVTIFDGSHKGKTRKVHHLVLEAFVGFRPDGMECRHKNNNPSDNRLDNIEWSTKSINNLDRVARGSHHQTVKTMCPRGHKLDGKNLSEKRLAENNKRICLSCSRAGSYVRLHPELDIQEVADRYYLVIYSY